MKNYNTLFDLSKCSETEKRYFELMLQEISEIESVRNVLDSVAKNTSKNQKINIAFSLTESDSLGESNIKYNYIRLQKLNFSKIPEDFKNESFFIHAGTLAHEITHFDNADKLKKIKQKLTIKQTLIAGFYDEIQAFLVDKDCDRYFRKKYHSYFSKHIYSGFTSQYEAERYFNTHSYESREIACLELLQGIGEKSYFYVDRRLNIALGGFWGSLNPKYGKGMNDKEFYSYLKKLFPKTEYIPENLSYKWCQKNSDGTYWIRGEKTHMLFDEKDRLIYRYSRYPHHTSSYIYSKNQIEEDGFIQSVKYDNENDLPILSLEEAKAYQSVCGNFFWGLGSPLAPLYFFAVTQSKKVKEMVKNTSSHLKKILKKGCSDEKNSKSIFSSKSSQK